MPVTDATIIRRSLTGRLFSTVTTALTVAVAVALLLTLLTLRDAGEQAFLRGGGNMHLVVSRDASELESVLNSVFYAGAPSAAITWDQYEDFLNRPPAAGAGGGGRTPPVIVQLDWAIPVQLGDSFRGLPVLATSLDFFEKFQPEVDRPFRVAEGRVFERSFEVVAGESCALSGVPSGNDLPDTRVIRRRTCTTSTRTRLLGFLSVRARRRIGCFLLIWSRVGSCTRTTAGRSSRGSILVRV